MEINQATPMSAPLATTGTQRLVAAASTPPSPKPRIFPTDCTANAWPHTFW